MINYKIDNRSCSSGEDGILNVRRIPARIDSKAVAAILGFQEHDIPVLVSAEMLSPLGRPVQNATKYFAGCVIEALGQSPKWLEKATQSIYDHWKIKNKAKGQGNSQGESRIPEVQETRKTKESETSLIE